MWSPHGAPTSTVICSTATARTASPACAWWRPSRPAWPFARSARPWGCPPLRWTTSPSPSRTCAPATSAPRSSTCPSWPAATWAPVRVRVDGCAMAQFDKDDVERLGLCKLDVLSVRMLSSMSHCREEVRRTRGIELDFDQIAWDDDDTYELIRSTRTLGCFQIESPGQRELVGKFQPEDLSDLVVDISLFRPGPVKGDMVGPFLQRRHARRDLAKTGYSHPILEQALGETFGVIVYHEQVMRCVAALTGCDLSVADLVRRRLGDPEELEDLHAWVLAGARKRGVGEEVAEPLWQAVAQFASFGFCKAHAAAFAVPTYRSAWLKAHLLPEFVAGLLTYDPGMYPRRLILDDARQFGVCVLPLDINASDPVHPVGGVD